MIYLDITCRTCNAVIYKHDKIKATGYLHQFRQASNLADEHILETSHPDLEFRKIQIAPYVSTQIMVRHVQKSQRRR